MLNPKDIIILVQAIAILMMLVALLHLRRRHRRLRRAYYRGHERRNRVAWERSRARQHQQDVLGADTLTELAS